MTFTPHLRTSAGRVITNEYNDLDCLEFRNWDLFWILGLVVFGFFRLRFSGKDVF